VFEQHSVLIGFLGTPFGCRHCFPSVCHASSVTFSCVCNLRMRSQSPSNSIVSIKVDVP